MRIAIFWDVVGIQWRDKLLWVTVASARCSAWLPFPAFEMMFRLFLWSMLLKLEGAVQLHIFTHAGVYFAPAPRLGTLPQANFHGTPEITERCQNPGNPGWFFGPGLLTE